MNTAIPATGSSVRPSTAGRDVPGSQAMWVFVLGDFLIFSSYFIVYMVKRIQAPELFLESQRHLSLAIGVANTVVLLTSSWFAAAAAQAARQGRTAETQRLLRWCGATGVLFVLVKAYEWTVKIAAGHHFTSSEFFSFYYFFTGIHLAHVLLGLGILVIVSKSYEAAGADGPRLIESGATYWHMVDLLWVVILALLYMMR